MLDDSTEKARRSIERARAAAHAVINRSLNQLRKLQTERISRQQTGFGGLDDTIAAEGQKIAAAQRLENKPSQDTRISGASPQAPELASNCNDIEDTRIPAASPAQIARNAQCPCKSGEKYKRCCGKNAPPVLGKAA